MSINADNHEVFKKALLRSSVGVERLLSHLKSWGYPCNALPMEIAPEYEQRLNYSDSGDVVARINGNAEIIEAKWVSFDFDGPDSWPHKWGVLAGNKQHWETRQRMPYRLFIIAAHTGCAAVIDPATKDQWIVKTIKDKRYKSYTQDNYLVPVRLCKFINLRG